MKKFILCFIIICSVFAVQAQEKGKFRVGLNGGFQIPPSGVGFGGDLDLRINVMDNLNVGAKFGGSIMMKDIVPDQSLVGCFMNYSLATGTYYFINTPSNFAPFVSGALGLVNLANVKAKGNSIHVTQNDIIRDRTIGGSIGGGFEAGKFRFGVDYFIIPSTTLRDLNKVKIGIIGNSYLNLSLGFYIGGGKWWKY